MRPRLLRHQSPRRNPVRWNLRRSSMTICLSEAARMNRLNYTIDVKDLAPEAAQFLQVKTEKEIVGAFEVGVSVLNRVQASADMDFVKGQVDGLIATVKGSLGVMVESTGAALSEMRQKYGDEIGRVTAENFHPSHAASYPKRFGEYLNAAAIQLKETVGLQLQQVKTELSRIEQNTSESETSMIGRARKIIADAQAFVQAQFDGRNTDGFAFRLGAQLEQLTAGIDHTVKGTIESRVRSEIESALRPISDGMVAIRETLAKEAGKAEMAAITSGKGFVFEDILFGKLEEVARPFGDSVVATGLQKEVSGSQKGDCLYTTTTNQLIVIEAKDKQIFQRESLDYMKLALEARGAKFGILVCKEVSQLQKQIGRWNLYNNSLIICCIDDIEMSLRCLRAITMVQRLTGDGINEG